MTPSIDQAIFTSFKLFRGKETPKIDVSKYLNSSEKDREENMQEIKAQYKSSFPSCSCGDVKNKVTIPYAELLYINVRMTLKDSILTKTLNSKLYFFRR
jgi:hypothetical protein